MTSRKEEERNEKIIRGLMKLPPNRRCINCNSLGPQYVCTNFWTFVCTTCSGIHREFTHRVKSVSMSKFTSQEVDALQKGGNQRAKEFFLRDWDSQRHRFADSSNAVNVREFINNVYVERQYAGGRTSDRPPRDMQNLGNHDDEVRRASSYHSYSQSPPYDFQYEERRYGKHTHVLSRKPGSDRGLYEGKFSSFLSPTRSSDHVYEDEFANGGASSRVSDYSVSSGGDPFRSGTQSPNSQRDIRFSSPAIETSRDNLHKDVQHQTVSTFSDANTRKSADGIPHTQRTTSLGSFGSFDSNSTSCKSVNSSGLVEVALGPGQCVETYDRKLHNFSSLAQSSLCGNYDGQDLFNVPSAPQAVDSMAPAVDLFQLPKTSSTPSIDLVQPSSMSSASILNTHQPSQSSSFSLFDSFSHMPTQPSAATLNEKAPDMVAAQDEGWATFDVPQHVAPNVNVENSTPATVSSSTDTSLGNFEPHFSLGTSLQWPSFQDIAAHGPASVPYLWHEVFHPVQASVNGSKIQSWNAFEDPIKHMPLEGSQQSSNQIAVHNPSFADEFLEKGASKVFYEDGIHKTGSDPPFAGVASHVRESLNMSATLNYMEGANSHATDCKSTNPFDLPFASDPKSSNTFLDMYSMQPAVPNVQMPSPFIGAVSQPWFSQDQVSPYTSTGPQGGLGFMEVQASGTQLSNVHSQGHVASFGNPFA